MSRVPPLFRWMCAGSILFAVGCAEKKEDMQPTDGSGRSAAERIRDLENQLAQAQNDLTASRERNLALQNQLGDCQDKQAKSDAPEGWTSFGNGAMTSIEGTLLFDSGQAKLRSEARQTLDTIARVIAERFPGHEVFVFGHTDSEPIRKSGWTDNEELSCQRALSVMRHLRSQGIMQPLVACGWGEQRPLTDNANASAKQTNRRVEIYAVRPEITGSASARR